MVTSALAYRHSYTVQTVPRSRPLAPPRQCALPLVAGARPHQPQRGGNVTASVPQVSLTLAAGEPSPGGRASWRPVGAARRAPPGGAPGRSGPSPPQPQPAEALLSLLPVSPALARSLARSILPPLQIKGGEGKGARPPFSQCRRHRRHRSANRRENRAP